MSKQDFNIALRYKCSPINLLHIFRTSFYKNTYEGLILEFAVSLNFFFNRHAVAFFERSVLKEVRIISSLSPQKHHNATI